MVRMLNELRSRREDSDYAPRSAVHKRDLLLTTRLAKASVVCVNLRRDTCMTRIMMGVPLIQA
jgi:hypothetical protein